MKKITLNKQLLLALIGLCIPLSVHAYNIGLLVMATGQYTKFISPLIESANKHFCKNHTITYFIFTDGAITKADNIVTTYQKKLGWPHDTMMRPVIYLRNQHLFADMDYLFACDADMLFVNEVGDEVLGDLVGTLHPGYVGSKGTYEKNPISKACIPNHEGQYYFAGGFWGGTTKEVLKLATRVSLTIVQDLAIGHIALWHDESHINRYFVDNPPTCILSPSYCYPESVHLPYTKRLLALDKNHNEIRK